MKKESTASRLKKIMNDNNLRQVDILNKTIPYCKKYGVKMNKSDISQYCSGKTEPNQDKLFVLGMALNVNEAWLMGFDVPMERNDSDEQSSITFDSKFDAAQKILENGGYIVSFSDDKKDDIITIKNSDHETVSCMHEYELVNKYESLVRRGKAYAELLAEIDLDLLQKQKDSRKRFAKQWNIQFFENKMLESFSQLSDENKEKSISYTENLLSNQKLEEELTLNAAQERTDIELTPEGKTNDDAIMDNDSEWE